MRYNCKRNRATADVNLDTSTPKGEFTANIRTSAAQFERHLIGQRTREALAQKRARGMRLGRPPEIDPATEEFIVTWRRAGLPLRAITQELNPGGVPRIAAGGYAWYASGVGWVLMTSEDPPFRAFPQRSLTQATILSRAAYDGPA